MSLNKASVTMQAACAAKATDPFLRQLDPINSRLVALLPEADSYRHTMDQYTQGMFTHTVCFRKKYFAQVLEQSAQEYSQVVVLCGGLDFSCLASQAWEGKPKFFIDHPLSLVLSLPLLEQAGVDTEMLHALGQDLATPEASNELAAALLSSGFDPAKPTLVLWEGASYYFEKSQILGIVEMLSALIPEIQLVFDFVLADPESSADHVETSGREKTLDFVKKHNEPWQSKFHEAELRALLSARHFQKFIFKTDKELIDEFGLELVGYRKMFGFLTVCKSPLAQQCA